MFLTWHLAHHLQMSKRSPRNTPRIVKATERALLLCSAFTGTQIVWCWSDHIKSPWHLWWPPEDAGHAFRYKVLSSFWHSCKTYKYARTHTHTQARALRGSIHLCNSACRGYIRGNLLITPSVVSQSTHAPIHQHTPICQSHSLLLVSRVLQVWEFVNSCVYASVLYICVQACEFACVRCVSTCVLLYVRVAKT